MFLSKISGKNYGKENFIFSKKLKCACVLGGGWMGVSVGGVVVQGNRF